MVWGFNFSIYGTAILIFLILVSGLSVWVFGANIRNYYKAERTGIKDSAVKIARHTYQSFEAFAFGKGESNLFYWVFPFQKRKKQFILPFNAFVSDSIYHVANTMHELAYLEKTSQRTKKSIYLLEKIRPFFLTLMAANISWMLVLSTWGGVAIAGALFIMTMTIDLSLYQRKVNKTANNVQSEMLKLADPEVKKDIRKYSRYLKLRIIKKYAICFLQPYVDAAIMVWNIGRSK